MSDFNTPAETDTTQPLNTIAEALLEISETFEQVLALMQEREAGFKARASRPSYGDRKPYARKSYGDDEGGGDSDDRPARKSYGPRKSFGDKPSYGDKKPYGDKKSFGDKKPFGGPKKFGGGKRSFSDDKKPARKTYKGGY